MANFQSNLLTKNNIFPLNSFPFNLNMFDNLSSIQYKGISSPRMPIDRDNSINLIKFIYLFKDNFIFKEVGQKSEGIHWYSIENKNKENEIFNNINKKCCKKGRIKNSFYNQKKENIYKNNYLINSNEFKNNKNKINNSIKEKQNLEPIPPKSIASIINNEIQNNNDFKTINNIIANNIDAIIYYNSIRNNNMQLPSFNHYNQKQNINLLNFGPINYYDFPKINELNPYTIFKNTSNIYKINKNISINGMKILDPNRKVHSASDDDNILRKIQVHFLSFIISFTNDVICTFSKEKDIPLFKNLDYKIKKVVNHKSIENLKKKTISEILQFKVSPKMKICDESVNRRIFAIIWARLPLLHKFLQTNYLTFFKDYYYDIKNKKIEVNGIEIQLSSKTKTFNDLIEKNSNYKEKIKYVAINYFLNCYKRIKKPNFRTQIYNNKEA